MSVSLCVCVSVGICPCGVLRGVGVCGGVGVCQSVCGVCVHVLVSRCGVGWRCVGVAVCGYV